MPTYRVRKNDSVLELAKTYQVSPDWLLKTNRIKTVSPGQVIKVPKPPPARVYGMPAPRYSGIMPYEGYIPGGSNIYNRPVSQIQDQPWMQRTREIVGNTGNLIGQEAAKSERSVAGIARNERKLPYLPFADQAQQLLQNIMGYGGTSIRTPSGSFTATAPQRAVSDNLLDQRDRTQALARQILSENPPTAVWASQANALNITSDLLAEGYTLQNGWLMAPQGGAAGGSSEGTYWGGGLSTVYDSEGRAISPWSQDISRRFDAAAAQGVNLEAQGVQQRAAIGGYTTAKSSTTGKDRDTRWWLRGKRGARGRGKGGGAGNFPQEYSAPAPAPAPPPLAPAYGTGLVNWRI